MACKGCGGSRRATQPRTMDASKLDRGDVPMEYTANTPPRTYRGRSGRIYRVDSGKGRRFMAHPSDVEKLLRLSVFRVVKANEAARESDLQVEPQPKPVSVVTMAPPKQPTPPVPAPEPEPEPDDLRTLPDPAQLSVDDIKALGLTPAEWETLLEAERAGKSRKTAITFMEAQAHGTSEHADAVAA